MTSLNLPSTPESLLKHVVTAMSGTPGPRLHHVLTSLTRTLHSFIRVHQVTEAEFEKALHFLVAIGQATGETKNEVVLAADLLGLSTLVAMLNNPARIGESDAALLGPFWRANAPLRENGDSIAAAGTPGVPLEVNGTVFDASGRPLTGATVDVWQASPVGLYENQDETQPDMNLRGRFITDTRGQYFFRSVRPAGYPVPTDGPCGDLLRLQRRHPNRPAHLHFMVSSPGHKVLVTQVFADDAAHLDSDPTFGVTEPLVGHFAMTLRDGQPLATLHHDLRLIPGERVFPSAPIP